MRTLIFQNYRQSDDPGGAGRIYDRLNARFGQRRVYFDQSVNKGGDRYKEEIRKHILAARVFLVLIGPRWLEAKDNVGRRRIDDPNDLLRKEIVWAQASPKAIIPLLLHGAGMPAKADLPEDIAVLNDLHAERISHGSFHVDVDRLIEVIIGQIRKPSGLHDERLVTSAERIRVPDPASINDLVAPYLDIGMPRDGNALSKISLNAFGQPPWRNALFEPNNTTDAESTQEGPFKWVK